ncbi:MAG TPA: hypothetical protein VLH38_00555 [Patescibacteria group bacterium]|nr:hypothetical protein [Patescibacteria group bacterium]
MTQNTYTTDDLLHIHEAFSATKHGKILAARVRYEKYKPEGVSNDEWIALLGPDVGNLSHLTFTYELTQKFIAHSSQSQPEILTDAEATTLKVAALIHDWAEAKTGDISWGDKTAEHEAEEQAAFDASFHEFYTGDATEVINRARKEVIFDHGDTKSKLGAIFNAIERVGYMTTALRAYDHISHETAGECEAGFTWLVADVFCNQTVALLEYAKQYNAVKDYLARKQSLIAGAFAFIADHSTVFAQYGEAEPNKRAQFSEAKNVWEQQIDNLVIGKKPSMAD